MNVVVASSAWLVGIYAGILLRAPLEIVLLGVFLFAGLALIWWPLRRVRLGALFVLVALFGLARSGAHLESSSQFTLPFEHSSSVVRIVGRVVEEPEARDRRTNLVLEIDRILLKDWEPASGRVLIRLARFPEFKYGDVLDLSGKLEQPPVFEDFDYRAYLARLGIGWVMDYPRVEKIGAGEGVWVLSWIYSVRQTLTDVLERSLPEPEASLAAGVLLGIRTTIPDDLLDAFSRTNTYHILAVSGLNISLLCGLLGAFGRRFVSRKYNLAFLLAGIVAYSSLVGPQPSVLRASIMGALLVVGNFIGRPADTMAWLLLSAGALTAYNPSLLADVGFQLSFASTAGLALLAPAIQSHLAMLPRWIGESISCTFAAQVASLPITAINFGQLSLITAVANLLVVPAVLPLMIGAAFTAVLGLLLEPAGQLAGWVTWAPATYLAVVVEQLGNVPGAAVSLGRFDALPLLPYYVVVGLFLVGAGNRALGFGTEWMSFLSRVPAKWVLGTLGAMTFVVWAGALTVPSGPTTVSFLDVGQGDAILVQTAYGRRVLIDGGPSPSTVSNALGRRLPFWDRSIDLVVLTHANDDHLMGLIEVIERHDVKLVLEPGIPHTSPAYVRWLEAIRQKNIRAVAARSGQEVLLDEETRLVVLYPREGLTDTVNADLNEHSVVLKLVAGGVSVLLTGDAGREAQREMLASGQELVATILKVPHHGGPGSIDPGFLAAVQPQTAVIPVGANNRFGHPAADTLRKLEDVTVYRTDLDGTVEVGIEAEGYWIKTSDRR